MFLVANYEFIYPLLNMSSHSSPSYHLVSYLTLPSLPSQLTLPDNCPPSVALLTYLDTIVPDVDLPLVVVLLVPRAICDAIAQELPQNRVRRGWLPRNVDGRG